MSRKYRPPSRWRCPPRPSVLSDPYHDHSEEARQEILRRGDDDLTWSDFSRLFSCLPAGTFEETAYFLPLALRFVRDRREHYEEFTRGLVTWVSRYRQELADIGGEELVRDGLRAMFRAWTETFRVTHFDREACRAKGWTLVYDDMVEGAWSVAELAYELVRKQAFSGVAVEFVTGLSQAASPAQAAWFLEFARWQAEESIDNLTGEPPTAEEEADLAVTMRDVLGMTEVEVGAVREAGRRQRAVRSDPIIRLVQDPSLRERAAQIVRASDLYDSRATYWQDTFRGLDIWRA